MKALLLAFFGGLCLASTAAAQTEITGRVLDPQDQPVAGIEVILHAVTEATGSDVDKDSTRATGEFTLNAGSTNPNAVYFVAVVYNGELYIGDLLRPPFPLDQEYVVRVGVNPVDISAEQGGIAPSPAEAQRDRSRGIVVVVAALLVIAALIALALSRRPPARRRWLVELARIEDDLASDADERGVLRRRRDELRARLKAAGRE